MCMVLIFLCCTCKPGFGVKNYILKISQKCMIFNVTLFRMFCDLSLNIETLRIICQQFLIQPTESFSSSPNIFECCTWQHILILDERKASRVSSNQQVIHGPILFSIATISVECQQKKRRANSTTQQILAFIVICGLILISAINIYVAFEISGTDLKCIYCFPNAMVTTTAQVCLFCRKQETKNHNPPSEGDIGSNYPKSQDTINCAGQVELSDIQASQEQQDGSDNAGYEHLNPNPYTKIKWFQVSTSPGNLMATFNHWATTQILQALLPKIKAAIARFSTWAV